MTTQIKLAMLAMLISVCFLSGAHWQYQRDKTATLEKVNEQVIARDALQKKLNESDLKLAEQQRSDHDVRTETVIQYRTKWRDVPVAVRESCATSGLYEITDAGFGSISKQ